MFLGKYIEISWIYLVTNHSTYYPIYLIQQNNLSSMGTPISPKGQIQYQLFKAEGSKYTGQSSRSHGSCLVAVIHGGLISHYSVSVCCRPLVVEMYNHTHWSYISFISLRILMLSLYLIWFRLEDSFHLQDTTPQHWSLFEITTTSFPNPENTATCKTKHLTYFCRIFFHRSMWSQRRAPGTGNWSTASCRAENTSWD